MRPSESIPYAQIRRDNQDMFECMIDGFESVGMPYCILAGYDQFPQEITSDVDFMVSPSWNAMLPLHIAAIAKSCGARLVQYLQHETTAGYFVLARLDGHNIHYLHPDSSSDYRRNGRLWIHAEKLLSRRRRHAHHFWVASAADSFHYYLIKKLDKQGISAAQANELALRYGEDYGMCRERLYDLLPAEDARMLELALNGNQPFEGGSWQHIIARLPYLRQALHANAGKISWKKRMTDGLLDIRLKWQRLRQPTGLSIVFLGPDGSGKSTLIDAVSAELSQAFRHVTYRHLTPGNVSKKSAGRIVTDPHAQAMRGKTGSFLKLLHFWSTYWIGSLTWLYPKKVCSTLVVFDRYYQDLLADPRRYRYSGSLKLAARLGRWLPQPDMVFILDAPAAVLQSRKQEVAPTESERQRIAYRSLLNEFEHASLIDTSQPLDASVNNVLEQVLSFLELRTAKRLKLSPATRKAPHLCKP